MDQALEMDILAVLEETEEHARLPLLALVSEQVLHLDVVAGITRVADGALHVLMGLGGKHLVGIQDEDPVTRGMRERGVAGRSEITLPRGVEDLRTEALRDRHGAVGGAGIDQDDLVDEPAHAREAVLKE
ncbi:hypothetical protein D3C87_1588730 [compost metagenome]